MEQKVKRFPCARTINIPTRVVSTLVTPSEPTLARHHHSPSRVCANWGSQTCDHMHPQFQCHAQWFHCPENPVHSAYDPSSPSSWPLLILLLFHSFLKYILLTMLLQLSHSFLPFIPLCSIPPFPPSFPHLSSCPWVMHKSSLASTFSILFLTSPCLLCTHNLCFLFPVPFPPSPLPLPADNPPCDLHFWDSVPVLVVCSSSWFFSGLVVDNCEFIVILLSISLIFFFLDKSL